jgi:hypothetical protein
LLNERQEDLVFFDQRIEKRLVTKLEGIVGSEFVHMDYGEAIPTPTARPFLTPPLAGEDPPLSSAKRPRGDIPTASN